MSSVNASEKNTHALVVLRTEKENTSDLKTGSIEGSNITFDNLPYKLDST